jgi:hypothetical protein
MWSCSECHQIYHHACASRHWFVGNSTCPSCTKITSSPKSPRCWCGKQDHGAFDLLGNSCGFVCGKSLSCGNPVVKCNKLCNNTCHPGPCEPVVCGNDCLSKQMTEITIQEAPLGRQSLKGNSRQEASGQSGGRLHPSAYSSWVSYHLKDSQVRWTSSN